MNPLLWMLIGLFGGVVILLGFVLVGACMLVDKANAVDELPVEPLVRAPDACDVADVIAELGAEADNVWPLQRGGARVYAFRDPRDPRSAA